MVLTYANIELVNAGDLAMAKRSIIDNEEIKDLHVNMLVDTGAYNYVSMRAYKLN
jgi:hypothetical protein